MNIIHHSLSRVVLFSIQSDQRTFKHMSCQNRRQALTAATIGDIARTITTLRDRGSMDGNTTGHLRPSARNTRHSADQSKEYIDAYTKDKNLSVMHVAPGHRRPVIGPSVLRATHTLVNDAPLLTYPDHRGLGSGTRRGCGTRRRYLCENILRRRDRSLLLMATVVVLSL